MLFIASFSTAGESFLCSNAPFGKSLQLDMHPLRSLGDFLEAQCRKKVGPGQWDLSVAEHLTPGEGYKEV